MKSRFIEFAQIAAIAGATIAALVGLSVAISQMGSAAAPPLEDRGSGRGGNTKQVMCDWCIDTSDDPDDEKGDYHTADTDDDLQN